MSRTARRAERLADAADARLPVLEGGTLLRKAFPEHWSFFLGEIALYSLLVLILTGVWLTFFFQPEMREVVYTGSYVPLQGVAMSAAFDSTLHISFDVRGGLLMRQTHHWAALVFVAAIGLHLLRIFFTGAFRRPRELNWAIGVTLFMLSLAEGFAGYSLPDDLLSGTGLRIAQGIMTSIPVVGTYLAFFAFGGEYPGHDIITRLYPLHILLLPGALIALVTAHLILVFHLKHTQWRGPGRTNRNVLGKPLYPQFTGTSAGLSLTVFGVLVLLSGLAQINPVWTYGPYRPDQVSTGSQPDWYVGFLEGALRLVPPWETNVAGHTVMWNVLLPAVVLPGLLFAALYAYPFVEQRLTGEWRHEQHLCDRPRERPVRTGLGVGGTVFYGVLLLAGANDIMAQVFRVSVDALTWILRVALVAAPVLAFLVTRWLCRALTAAERERLAEGVPTGDIRQSVTGGYEGDHEPVESFRPGAPRKPLTGARTGTPSRTPRAPEHPDR
ncbi:menaquinol-cytochrome c reductase cytochrome b subunit precursor [Streptomyces sp. 1222.5]|uniref:cytochrome bc1 complex cytochrome b subunit n=1 Tax=unclassified Streptomyces TaxID=2593676 RepID=UPI00089B229A|nr:MULTISPECIES: ubiquinol-cytochrome c reductase cytochrome b subunit [unclassified Streptomyces]PKW11645.1 menaquinol-cytochrome c reductase cytochrome b subunit precursor [Streptomyces sp. 5112.2]SEB73490.1 menaquinol-cytochrome c reductase cytochrome b subunit precursor [Streptomyces sp. 1222.5]